MGFHAAISIWPKPCRMAESTKPSWHLTPASIRKPICSSFPRMRSPAPISRSRSGPRWWRWCQGTAKAPRERPRSPAGNSVPWSGRPDAALLASGRFWRKRPKEAAPSQRKIEFHAAAAGDDRTMLACQAREANHGIDHLLPVGNGIGLRHRSLPCRDVRSTGYATRREGMAPKDAGAPPMSSSMSRASSMIVSG